MAVGDSRASWFRGQFDSLTSIVETVFLTLSRTIISSDILNPACRVDPFARLGYEAVTTAASMAAPTAGVFSLLRSVISSLAGEAEESTSTSTPHTAARKAGGDRVGYPEDTTVKTLQRALNGLVEEVAEQSLHRYSDDTLHEALRCEGIFRMP